MCKIDLFNHNNEIGDSGACSIGEALKVNSTLVEINLSAMAYITSPCITMKLVFMRTKLDIQEEFLWGKD